MAADRWTHPVSTIRGEVRRRQRQWATRVLQPPRPAGRVICEVNPDQPHPLPTFRLFAVLGTWMEADVVEATVRNALAQGVEQVHLVDNGSRDATVDIALAAGATVAEEFRTDVYDEQIRIALMNAVVARTSLASEADHVWWLWMDGDEFPEGPDGTTIVDYLATLDHRFRLVGSTYYNHYPATKPEYIPGFHPVDFQPLCQYFKSKDVHHCPQPHWKHPLQRFDRDDHFIAAGGGFHTGLLRTNEPLREPVGGIVTHHVPYRDEAVTRTRMELLCGVGRNASNDGLGNRTIQRRFDSLQAVYDRRWDEVNNLSGEEPLFGVHPEPWTGRPGPRWYSTDDLEEAKAAWRARAAAPAP